MSRPINLFPCHRTAGKAHCLGTKVRQNCPLSSLVRQCHWMGSLLSCPCKCNYRVGYSVSQVFWLCFLIRQDWGLCSAVGNAKSLFPHPGGAEEEAPRPSQLVIWRSNQAELCIKYSSQRRSPVWLLGSADGQSHWLGLLTSLQGETWSAQVQLLAGYCKPFPLLYLSVISSVKPHSFPVTPLVQDPSEPPWGWPAMLGRWTPLWAFFPTGESIGLWGLSVWHCTILWEGRWDQSLAFSLTLLMRSFLVSMVQRSASTLPPC